MTESEAISKVNYFPIWNEDDRWLGENEMEVLSDMAIKALEKQIPKDITEEYIHEEYNTVTCPHCGGT